MTVTRDDFLRRVRDAVAAGNRAGVAHGLPDRGQIGYQGAGADPVARFRDELAAAGGKTHIVPSSDAALAKVIELVHAYSARRVLLGRGTLLDSLDVAGRLRPLGVEIVAVDTLRPESDRGPLFAADVGISGADFLIAETGSVTVLAKPSDPRSLSLLPPVHIVVARRDDLIPDLFDLFERLKAGMPSGAAIITGPSKTGDIELRLVTGVHGPGEVHVIQPFQHVSSASLSRRAVE